VSVLKENRVGAWFGLGKKIMQRLEKYPDLGKKPARKEKNQLTIHNRMSIPHKLVGQLDTPELKRLRLRKGSAPGKKSKAEFHHKVKHVPGNRRRISVE